MSFLLNPSIWYLFEHHDRVRIANTRRIENRLLVCPKVGSSAWWEFVFCASSKLNGLESYLCCYQVSTPHLSCPEMIHLLKHVFVFVIYKEELPANLGGKFCTAFRNVKLSLLILFWPSKTWEEKTHMARIASYKSHFSLFQYLPNSRHSLCKKYEGPEA